jgi:hypothetical protein
MIKPQPGQRWRYKDSDINIIVEILSQDACKIIQFAGSFREIYNVGQVRKLYHFCVNSDHAEEIRETWSWTYLIGQDSPSEK